MGIFDRFRQGSPQEGCNEKTEKEKQAEILVNDPEFVRLFQAKLAEKTNQEASLKAEQRESGRLDRRNQFLSGLDVGLSVGKPVEVGVTVRGQEVLGIYKDGKHIGNIFGDSNLEYISDKELEDKVFRLVREGSESADFKLNADSLAESAMANTSVILDRDSRFLRMGRNGTKCDLYNKGENKEVNLRGIDQTSFVLEIVESTSGKVITYIVKNGVFLTDSRKVSMKR